MENTQPTVTPTPTPTPVAPVQKKSKLALVLSIVVLIAVVGGVLAYNTLGEPSARVILQKSVEASKEIRSFTFSIKASGKADSTGTTSMNTSSDVSMTAKGAVDFPSLEKLAIDIDTKIKSKMGASTTSGTVDLGLHLIYKEKNIYVNISDLTTSFTVDNKDPQAAQMQMALNMVGQMISGIQNQWIKFDLSKLTKNASTSPDSLTKEEWKMISDYLGSAKYIKKLSKVGTESINGTDTYHLKMSVQYGQDAIDLINKLATKRGETLSEEEQAQMAQFLNQTYDFDVWVGKDDYMVYKVLVDNMVIEDAENGIRSTLSEEILFTDYNKPATITAPANSKSVEEVLQGLMGGMMMAPKK